MELVLIVDPTPSLTFCSEESVYRSTAIKPPNTLMRTIFVKNVSHTLIQMLLVMDVFLINVTTPIRYWRKTEDAKTANIPTLIQKVNLASKNLATTLFKYYYQLVNVRLVLTTLTQS